MAFSLNEENEKANKKPEQRPFPFWMKEKLQSEELQIDLQTLGIIVLPKDEVVLNNITNTPAEPTITQRTIEIQSDETVHMMTHYHYSNWKDHTPPPSEDLLYRCLEIALEHIKIHGNTSPIAINCAGGVGRTGVLAHAIYIVTDVIKQINSGLSKEKVKISPTKKYAEMRALRKSFGGRPQAFACAIQVAMRYIKDKII